jgi:6-phosphofructokinase 1
MSLLAGVDRVIIPEVPYDPDKLAHLAMMDKSQTPANYAVILVCDGSRIEDSAARQYAKVISPDGQPPKHLIGSGMVAAELLSHITGEEVFLQPLTYLLRTGLPDGQDLLGATNFAFIVARLLADGKFGRMAAFVQDKMWTDVDISLAGKKIKTVDLDTWYDSENYKPKLALIWSDRNN